MSIKREELQVGVTYTDVGEKTRTIIFIGTKKLMYTKENGSEYAADIEVMLDALDLQVIDKRAA